MDLTQFSRINTVPPIAERLSEGLKTIAMSNYSSPLDALTEIMDNLLPRDQVQLRHQSRHQALPQKLHQVL